MTLSVDYTMKKTGYNWPGILDFNSFLCSDIVTQQDRPELYILDFEFNFHEKQENYSEILEIHILRQKTKVPILR